MKKRFLSIVAVAMVVMFLSAGSVFAADGAGKNFISDKVGVGFQGMVAGSFLNGLSARGWIGDRVGLEGSVFYGKADIEATSGGYTDETDADLWMLEFKAMYALVVRDFSKFYIGGKIGYGQVSVSEGGLDAIDGEALWTPGVFVGAEWSFPQLPEVGFNFDVGYSAVLFNPTINGNEDVDIKMHGVNATFGVHYYF
jgi:hypothetical protein